MSNPYNVARFFSLVRRKRPISNFYSDRTFSPNHHILRSPGGQRPLPALKPRHSDRNLAKTKTECGVLCNFVIYHSARVWQVLFNTPYTSVCIAVGEQRGAVENHASGKSDFQSCCSCGRQVAGFWLASGTLSFASVAVIAAVIGMGKW